MGRIFLIGMKEESKKITNGKNCLLLCCLELIFFLISCLKIKIKQ